MNEYIFLIQLKKIKDNKKKLDGFYLEYRSGRETKKIQNHYTKLLLLSICYFI